ncbi:unnamed protein product [Candida verbasci]|uniref:Protein DSF2 n=1 Tax=Candida verbasci TaxID=1227364 RepID=A0A9W4X9M4_9ASCO|nr:unnamed protein product [Candida verbasci]
MDYNDDSSPLQTLKQQLKYAHISTDKHQTRLYNNDRESIYSFDSVSTNGRLLDRLGLDDNDEEEGENDENFYDKRQSYMSIQSQQSTGRLLDRLDMDNYSIKNKPLNNLNNIRGLQQQPQYSQNSIRYPQRQTSLKNQSPNVHVRYAPMNLVFENTNTSSESIESNKAQLKKTTPAPSSSESIPVTVSTNSSSSRSSVETTRPTTKESENYESSPKLGHQRNLSDSKFHRRNLSETMLNSDLSAEERTSLALELRSLGKHREASYQLQISSNEPYNYPRAMFLYAMALKFGQGVKQNDNHAVKWLCKCILVSSSHLNSSNVSMILDKLNFLSSDEIIKLIVKNLDNTIDKDPLQNGQNLPNLDSHFQKLTKAQIAKVVNISNKKLDVIACSYHELGNYLLLGIGISSKDEMNGINLLSKAGSMGYIPSMIQLGELWTSKTKNHKKDLVKAAGWLRVSEFFGFKSIGNSWIYKEKYMY